MSPKAEEKYIVYIDTGGTFSDAVVVKPDGTFMNGKAPTTAQNLEECFFNCIESAAKNGGKTLEEILSKTEILGYGTTAGTNAILTRYGAPKLGLIITKGFEDTTMIGRGMGRWAGIHPMESIHIPTTDRPDPLIPRRLIKGVTERIDSAGEEIIPLYEHEAEEAVKELLEEGVDGICVVFLWSFLNESHEMHVKEIIEKLAPDLPVSFSCETSPLIREFSRTNSTIVNLYIGTALKRLLETIKEKLSTFGYNKPFLVMQAAGGLSRSEVVRPVTTLHSGPVGGLVGVRYFKDIYGLDNVIGSDVGGTSFDVSILPKEGSAYIREPVVARFAISNPMMEIISIGAGGGTIAYIDELTGMLRVGPRSAGAVPGPVCYQRGGTEPTVTDADVVLGRIDPDYFLGGTMKLDKEGATKAIKDKIADPLNISVEEAAHDICAIIDKTMADTLASTVRLRGLDPTEFSVFGFGGAGPTHCGGYTAGIGFKDVIVCPFASTFSAYGASTADVYHRYENSPFVVLPDLPFNVASGRFTVTEIVEQHKADIERYNRICETLIERAYADMDEEGFKRDEVVVRFMLEMRYGGQLHEVVTRPEKIVINNVDDFNHILNTFEEEYIRLYSEGAMYPGGGVEIYNIVVEVSAGVPKPTPIKHPLKDKDPSPACKGSRNVWFDKGYVKSNVYEMLKLDHGNQIAGPAIIEGVDTTFVVPPDRDVLVDEHLNMVMTQKE
jgi:N-methylhydantoinase A/oxoprolinase/acetone carboxylase beta subunit